MKSLKKWIPVAFITVALVGALGITCFRQIADTYKTGPLTASEADPEDAPSNPFYQDYSMLDNQNAAIYWNDWGNYYTHAGPAKNIFQCYSRAIELNPQESVYYQNLATSLFLYRKDAREFFNVDEQVVFDMALRYYSKAMILDPENYDLAQDVAKSYYAIKPLRLENAMSAWDKAMKLASNDVERQEIYVHCARLEYMAGNCEAARTYLQKVSFDGLSDQKGLILQRVREIEAKHAQASIKKI